MLSFQCPLAYMICINTKKHVDVYLIRPTAFVFWFIPRDFFPSWLKRIWLNSFHCCLKQLCYKTQRSVKLFGWEAFTQWRHKSLMGASAGGFMSRRYNVNMAENYSYFSNFEGKYLRNYLKLVHQTLDVVYIQYNIYADTVTSQRKNRPLFPHVQ